MGVLEVTWFILIGVLFTVYAVLDGFDLGIGIMYPFSPKEEQRVLQKVISPFWDGNEIWLLAGIGALFAVFPGARSALFSGFFLPVMIVLFALIYRAAAIHFIQVIANGALLNSWTIAFSITSILPPLVFGIMAGNLLRGIPLNTDGMYSGTFYGLFSHYTIVAGLTGVVMFVMQGSLYLALKTTGAVKKRALTWAGYTWLVYLILFLYISVRSVIVSSHISVNFWVNPKLLLVPLCGLGTIIAIRVLLKKRRMALSFAVSTASIILMMAIFGISIFPNIVFQLGDFGKSLKISNAASSETTLIIMLVTALIGIPVVVMYNVYVRRVFRGKGAAEDTAY